MGGDEIITSFLPAILVVSFGLLVWWLLFPRQRTCHTPDFDADDDDPLLPVTIQNVIVKTYSGSRADATARFKTDAVELSEQGYFPTSQTWAPGTWGASDFFVALFLCLLLIGILVFVYMLLVRPNTGSLSVTYELRAIPVKEKTCPKCAEQVKAAAVACRFCGHEFAA